MTGVETLLLRVSRTSPTVRSPSQQTMRGCEVSIGGVEGRLAESRPHRRSALPQLKIDAERTEACALCGHRQVPLDSACWIASESAREGGRRTASPGPAESRANDHISISA